ncbi:hypothetical protein [Chelativorans alearense]|uniref:hypothetical protein n=1 Tax=Chelativorans alearense TaxID=2681495 RepID=UPI0013D65381|nr:hypothetical protein [Chelativorans alearense]
MVLYLLSALAFLCGCAFLIGAMFVVAVERWTAEIAALYFALGFLALAAGIFGLCKFLLRRRTRRAELQNASHERLLTEAAVLTLLPSLLANKGGTQTLLVPLVALAGWVIYRENRRAATNREKDGAD